jgi:adenine phosphoribosyltransferase
MEARVDIESYIRDINDFPKPGIVFKDITPLLANPQLFAHVVDRLAAFTSQGESDVVLAPESRGFLLASAVADKLGRPLVVVRKPGKLPYKTVTYSYQLEYGSDTLAIHEDALRKGQRVMIIDDVLATGGTVEACAKLAEKLGGVVSGASFVIELSFLHGRDRLKPYKINALIDYTSE